MVPGAQPGLSEFEEHGSLIGVHTLLTHTILEHLAEQEEKVVRIRFLSVCVSGGHA
jgi:hypothetical protein